MPTDWNNKFLLLLLLFVSSSMFGVLAYVNWMFYSFLNVSGGWVFFLVVVKRVWFKNQSDLSLVDSIASIFRSLIRMFNMFMCTGDTKVSLSLANRIAIDNDSDLNDSVPHSRAQQWIPPPPPTPSPPPVLREGDGGHLAKLIGTSVTQLFHSSVI